LQQQGWIGKSRVPRPDWMKGLSEDIGGAVSINRDKVFGKDMSLAYMPRDMFQEYISRSRVGDIVTNILRETWNGRMNQAAIDLGDDLRYRADVAGDDLLKAVDRENEAKATAQASIGTLLGRGNNSDTADSVASSDTRTDIISRESKITAFHKNIDYEIAKIRKWKSSQDRRNVTDSLFKAWDSFYKYKLNRPEDIEQQKAKLSEFETQIKQIQAQIKESSNFAKGGVVYANQGMLIPYQPKGTDTVPAMLTPGEFVINRQATQKHLPLLKAINNGASPTGYSSGGIAYLGNGGLARREEEEKRRKAFEDSRTFRSGLSAAKLGPMGTMAVMEIVQTPQNFDLINPQAINEELEGSVLADKISAKTDSLETDIKKQGYLLNEASKFNSRASYLYRIATNSQKVLDDDRGSIDETIGDIIRNNELNTRSQSAGMGMTLKAILTSQVESAKKEWEAIKSASDILKQKYLGMVPQNQGLNQTSDAGPTIGPAPITASKGMLIPYQPKGTDTVPAMLTPGEFVVNRAATQANLPLLKAINNGAQGYNVGGIAYRSNGGPVQYFSDGTTQGPVQAVSTQFTNSLESATRALTNFGVVVEQLKNAFNQNKNPPTSQNQQNSSGGVNIDMKGISQFTTRLQSLILQLENLSQIPTEIKMIGTHRVDVNILGAEAFQNLDPAIADLIKGEIHNAIAQYNQQTFYV